MELIGGARALAKTSLDWAVYDGKKVVLQTANVNTVSGIKTVLRLLKKLPGWNPQQTVFCMEHTGIYRGGGPQCSLT